MFAHRSGESRAFGKPSRRKGFDLIAEIVQRLVKAIRLTCLGGVPLASACGGLKEAVVDKVTGFLLPPGEPDAWVGMIVEISQWSAERRAVFIERSVAETAARYSWTRVALETFQAYEAQ